MNATLSPALSPAQHGIWLTERTLDTGAAYHLTVTVDLDGPLDTDSLVRACSAVAAHHPALGTVFAPDGTPGTGTEPSRPRVVGCAAAELDALLSRERSLPFDLAHGPLHRFVLFRLSPVRHVLVLTAHHLVFDGESKDRLVGDLATAYRGGPLTPVPPQPVVEPAPGALADAEAHWAGRWREPATPTLPGLAPSPVAGTTPAPGAEISFGLGPGRSALLDTTARRLGLTRFELLTASWHALLARYGDPAPVTAVELSLRPRDAAVGVGLAVHELPLFSTPDPAAPFALWSRTVRAELRALYRHRAVPLGRSVRGLTPRTALTPLSLSYRRRPAAEPVPDFGAEVRAEVRWIGFCGTARNLLHLQLVDAGTEIGVSLQYRADALTTEWARRIAGHWTTLLDGVLADPGTPVGDLPVPAPEERSDQLAAPAPRPELHRRTVPELFARSVADRPGAVAVVCGDEALTYRELSALVAHAATALRRRGAGPDTLVGIGLPRGRDQLVAVLASLACGAAYLPLDPGYPAERLAFIRSDSRLALRITARADGPGDLVPADLAPDGTDTPALPPPPSPDHPAYVLYTSGSTGRPKGVEVPHSALANVLGALRDHLGSRPEDRWLGLTSLSFDISAVELLLPLISGGRVVLVPEGGHRDGPALLGLVHGQGITHVQATPSGWRLLLDAGLTGAAGLTALTGGEALPPSLARDLTAVSKRLVNVYGPTETTIWSSLAEPAVTDDGEVLIGEPLANTRAYVLDERLHPVPYGLPGELFLGGAGLAHGYRHRPGLTATRFVPDPYGPPGARLYRTGDLVRRRAGGGLVYVGRSDTQVKLRGHRIELGEIETRLASHPSVAQAAAAVHGADGDRRLSAYVVPAGPAPTAQELHAHLSATLPAAAVPGTYTVLDAFPLTPNGKLDRAALPEPVPDRRPAPADDGEPGLDPTTEAVLAIWREVLELDDLGPDEDLFDLGGHSLTITAIAARIHRSLGVDVPLDVFFDAPTVHGVTAAVTALRKE